MNIYQALIVQGFAHNCANLMLSNMGENLPTESQQLILKRVEQDSQLLYSRVEELCHRRGADVEAVELVMKANMEKIYLRMGVVQGLLFEQELSLLLTRFLLDPDWP